MDENEKSVKYYGTGTPNDKNAFEFLRSEKDMYAINTFLQKRRQGEWKWGSSYFRNKNKIRRLPTDITVPERIIS